MPTATNKQAAVLQCLAQIGREVQAPGVLGQELLEAGLPDRHLALQQTLDLGSVDVDAPHLAAQLREARGGDEPDVAGADDPNRLALSHLREWLP